MFANIPTRRSAMLVLGALLATGAVACGDDDPSKGPTGAGDPEFVNYVELILTPVGGGDPVTVSVRDPDGQQSPDSALVFSGPLALEQGVTYNGVVRVLNTVTPGDTIYIQDEISEERDEHQFFYTIFTARDGSGNPIFDATRGITVTITDEDSNELPVGLTFQVAVDDDAPVGNTTLSVVLGHYDDVVKDGETRSNESDIDVEFDVTVSAAPTIRASR